MEKDVLRGEAYWASVRKPNAMSGKLQMDLGNMDKPSLALLKKAGVITRNKGDEKGDFITLKGSPQYPPKITDSKCNLLPEPVSIGNGSKVKVPFKPYEWSFQGKKGVNVGLNSVMVIEMIDYSNNDMETEDGYVAPTQTDLAQVDLLEEDEPF
tara:strand:+ start:388 stop:849 length:462 start_codon:yes stop_codon:yes gene_type:complete